MGFFARKLFLVLGLSFNLGVLCYFKYLGFLIGIVSGLAGRILPFDDIVLPLGISFITFQKIGYLVDSYLGKAKESSFLNYLLFVSFFPQLIAGPIVHYSEVIPQFKKADTYLFSSENLADGLVIFLLGLAKKVVLADEFGRYANAGFGSAAEGLEISFVPAWMAVLAYSLQIYFDFSGYSDMAIGLARVFSIDLPLNFNSPYKATSIIDFWRRWHITLSRFLRDYVYIPLGGNRYGPTKRYWNLLLTMVLGGLWHGAAWTFVLWGALHGTYLLINHLWRNLVPKSKSTGPEVALAQIVTLLAVMSGWVVFRSNTLASSISIYRGMIGLNGAVLSDQVLAAIPWLSNIFGRAGNVPGLSDSTVMGTMVPLVMIGFGFLIVLLVPNLYQLSNRLRYALLIPSFAFTLQRVLFASDISPFLYFQF
jgi:D-alanyl-lipoteichoic acid acyltransferase DltB (MBOAT superfamily)